MHALGLFRGYRTRKTAGSLYAVMMRIVAALLIASALCGESEDRAIFTEAGELVRPVNYREWVFLSSGLGMTYGPNAPAAGSRLRFDNVYVNPSSYRQFLKTGSWVDGTVLILEIRESESKGSINQHGHYQSSLVAMEANVKDTKRFPDGGWGFFEITPSKDNQSAAAKPHPRSSGCKACHTTNGAVDSTFVQFYPELAPVAKKLGTFRESPRPSETSERR